MPGPEVVSCPTCGRTNINVAQIASEVEERLRGCNKPIKVAVMGCVVNGPGEARGADIESGGLMQRVRALVPILIPLFVSSFRRAYELAMAMECRCYHGGEGRTRMKQLHMVTRDVVCLLVMAALIGGLIALNILIPAVL